MMLIRKFILPGAAACGLLLSRASAVPFGIHVVDDATGRGVPLAVLETVNAQTFITDNAGWIAFDEPGLMDRETWFSVTSPGYRRDKDGFGYAGVRLTPAGGRTAEVRVKRTIPAERTGRLTGQGLYRDSALLGKPCPLPNLNPGGVLGQDSVQAVPWQGKIFWLWGDTSVSHYPLGNFHTTCATSDPALRPEDGLAFDYFMDPAKPDRLRAMMPLEGPGVVWLFGLLNAGGETPGKETLFCHYGRYPGLAPVLEQGIAAFDETAGIFKPVTRLEKSETWRFPRGHAVKVSGEEGDWFYFSSPLPHTRVRATAEAVRDPGQYEALVFEPGGKRWTWQRSLPPVTQADEARLLKEGKIPPDQARFQITDAAGGGPVRIHTGSVQWNAWRNRWILIGVQSGDKGSPSALGEVWYAESRDPGGPWTRAVKVASHPQYTYYNPVHHGFLDARRGQVIYFEGTYTAEFSGNPVKTPRYDYNQLQYRLDLAHPGLAAARLE